MAAGLSFGSASAAMPKPFSMLRHEDAGPVVEVRSQRYTLQQIAQAADAKRQHRMIYSSKPALR
jgi:hypothetical protein